MKNTHRFKTFVAVLVFVGGMALPASSQTVKGQDIKSLLSAGGGAEYRAKQARMHTGVTPFAALAPDPGDGLIPPSLLGGDPGPNPAGGDGSGSSSGKHSGFKNVFVNDPCSDPAPTAPFPTNFFGVVQSETEIAVLNRVRGDQEGDNQGDNGGSGRLMVAGYNDSLGFYDNRQGLSGFSYSTDGGNSWIDGGGLPPLGPTDQYFGDPVVVVHHKSKTFYYASLYSPADGTATISVNRGHFKVAPPQGQESEANTRCANDPSKFGVPDPPQNIRERIIWEPPVVAVPLVGPAQNDFLDKEWLYVDQKTGFLYLTYTRFGSDFSTPIELVRSFDGGRTWTPPSVIVPNLLDAFNQATQPVVTPTGRVVVSWLSRIFPAPAFVETKNQIQVAFSDDGGNTFGLPVKVANVNPQGEPRGYNRGRASILNAPYITVDQGINDGMGDERGDGEEGRRPGFGNVYITYFDGKTPLTVRPFSKAADIKLSVSADNGATYQPPVKVNDDSTLTSHVFSSVQVNKHGTVFVTWIDRRVDPQNNILNDTWAAFSQSQGGSFGENVRVTNVSTDWFARADARPNFGDYNSSEVIDFENFVSIWSDARFPEGTFVDRGRTRRAATPDTLFAIVGNGSDTKNHDQGGNGKE